MTVANAPRVAPPTATPVFPAPPPSYEPPVWTMTEPPDYYGEPNSTAPPGTLICYVDPTSGASCYVTELDNKQKTPIRLFVPGSDLKFAEKGVEKAYMSFYAIQTKDGHLGSGINVMSVPQEDGTYLNFIFTNRHVVVNEKGQVDSSYLAHSLWTGEAYQGTAVAVLPENMPDHAFVVIKSKKPLPAIPHVNSEEVGIGQKVFAIGNPLGFMGVVTAGIISHTNPTHPILEDVGGRVIMFDAAISPGNSGGPLITQDGRLIALNTFTVPGNPENPAQNLNFAFPADVGLKMLFEMLQMQMRPAA